MKKCPYCGADIEDEARFCVYCMKQMTQSINVSAPKTKSKFKIKVVIISSVCIAVAVIVALTAILMNQNKIIEPEEFKQAAAIATERLKVSDVWSPDTIKDIRTGKGYTLYTAEANYGFDLSLAYADAGDEWIMILDGITDENYSDSIRLTQCIADTACNSYLEDIEDVLTDDEKYPFNENEVDFVDYLKHMFGITGRIQNIINQGAENHSYCKTAYLAEDDITVYFEKTTATLNGKNQYRIYMEFIVDYEKK